MSAQATIVLSSPRGNELIFNPTIPHFLHTMVPHSSPKVSILRCVLGRARFMNLILSSPGTHMVRMPYMLPVSPPVLVKWSVGFSDRSTTGTLGNRQKDMNTRQLNFLISFYGSTEKSIDKLFDLISSVHENHRTCQTFPMAGPKCLMRDFTNLNTIYKAHRTNVWWAMKVFQLHWISPNIINSPAQMSRI